MATNIIPANSAQLGGLAQKICTGIIQVGATVPVTMVTAAQLQGDLDAFIAVDAEFNAARSARLAASEDFQAAMEVIYEWLLGVSNVLVARFGTRWSTAWAQAGFINHSTGIPAKTEERLGLALSLVKFFTAKPSFEVPSMKFTAAEGTALRTTALAAQEAAMTAAVSLTTLGESFTTIQAKLVATMRTLIKNLEGLLAKDDPRWLAFGLNMPATNATPGRPANVVAQLDESGAIVVQCGAVPLATRYRWRTQIVGVQENYQLAQSTTEPLAVIGGMAAGQTVQIIVQAVNGKQQGVASEPVRITLNQRMLAATTSSAMPTPAYANGNGNGNGAHREIGELIPAVR